MTTSGPAGSLAARLVAAPLLADPARARARLDDLRASLPAQCPLRTAMAVPATEALLGALADHSPFLWRLASLDPERLVACLVTAPEEHLAACLDAMGSAATAAMSDAMRLLRQAKQRIALLAALADLGGVWDLDAVTSALTAFADRAVQVALACLLGEAHRAGKLRLPDPANPEERCGLVVLALGKQGAAELNYSSDIDIVAFFDPAAAALPPAAAAGPLYVRITQTLARMLGERTADGYVLRVDLRLRPDPGSTAVAIGLPSAFAYYERYGQNWERAALIKARPVAGEVALGAAFLADLAPFVWRKYFDYGAIADVHAMKRQIHAVRGHAAIAVAGHDVKLGRGGIREVEFFVQTQQLIFGGRRPGLRGARTLDMLAALRDDGWIDTEAVDELGSAYRFLRGIEHRLQMIADEQTQRLPLEPDALAAFARFAGFVDTAAFTARFTHEARAVERHYARLFEHAPGLDGPTGNLVFTGVEDDPGTIATLRDLGFARPTAVAEAVRGWHFGRRSAVQTQRARQLLTDLVPSLLLAFGRSGDPDAALLAFDTMLGRMPGAAELFALLAANPALLELFADILGVAPRLAATVAARPHVLDGVIAAAGLAGAGDPALLATRVDAALDPALPPEVFLDRARDLAQEEMFLIGVRLLAGSEAAGRAGEAYADLAATFVRATLAHCAGQIAAVHGQVPGSACVVLAMGRLGSREMTAGSDLDLILIYDADPAGTDSDGPRPLDAGRYFSRLTQRLIAALTVATRRGLLYAVDMRLRPSGGQGPLATRLSSFVRYQGEAAATWEHLALTRARVVAGDATLAASVENAIAATLAQRRDATTLRADVVAMRALVAREKGQDDPWDLKCARGGLLDIDFIAQALVLLGAANHSSLRARSTGAILRRARNDGLLDDATGEALLAAYVFLSDLMQILRLTTDAPFVPMASSAGLRRRLALAVDLPSFTHVEAELAAHCAIVRGSFVTLLGDPDAPRSAEE